MASKLLRFFKQMLNNFASDLDVLLSDLSQSCPLTNPSHLHKAGTSLKDSSSSSNLEENHYDHCPVITPTNPTTNCRITPILIDQETRPISFWERLEKSRSIWYLPDIGRIGAVHLLKDGIPGMFIVRQSTHKNSMALSVHLSQSEGPVVEHYLIEDYNEAPHLQGSDKTFTSMPQLIYNYCKNLEDLPHLLVLPDPILKADTSQKLASLALLGQAFWMSDIMKKSLPSQKPSPDKCCLHKSPSEPISMSSKALSDGKVGPALAHNSTNTIPVGGSGARLAVIHKTKPFAACRSRSSCSNASASAAAGCGSGGGGGGGAAASCGKSKSKSSCSDSYLVTSCVSKTSHPHHHHHHSHHHRRHHHHPRHCDDSSSQEGSDINVKVHRSHTHPQINALDLPPRATVPGDQSADLLSVPSYFHSNLSDKLSDYEDVWKNSPSIKSADIDCSRMFSDSEAENNFTLNLPKTNPDLPSTEPLLSESGAACEKKKEDLYSKSSHDICFNQQKNVEDLYSMSTHDIKFKLKLASTQENGEQSISSTQHSNAVAWPSQSACHVDGCLVRQGSTSHKVPHSNSSNSNSSSSNNSSSSCSTHTCERHVERQKKIPLAEELTTSQAEPSSNVNEDLSVVSGENPAEIISKPPEKSKPPPLTNVQYIKKCSDGKTRSPVYTEPFDSIGVNSVVFPAASSANKQVYGQKSTPQRERRQNRILYQPTLEPIYSPSGTQNNNNNNNNNNNATVFSFDKYKIKNGKTSSDLNNNANNHSTQVLQAYNDNTKKSDKIELKYDDKGSLQMACSQVADNILATMNMKDTKANTQTLHKFPVNQKNSTKDADQDLSTLEDMISPQLTLKPMEQPNVVISSKMSEYDNLNQYRAVSMVSDAGTVFSKPWDSEKWDNILKCEDLSALPLANPMERIQEWRKRSQNYTEKTKVCENLANRQSVMSNTSRADNTVLPDSVKAQMLQNKVMKEIIAKAEDKNNLPLLTPSEPFDKHLELTLNKSPGMNLKEYVLHLANSPDTFGLQIKHFVECTKESQETNPRCVMSNVRQFMTGMKNYLFHNNQKGLNSLIQRESSRLGANEILNIDAIIESSLHESVILPLKRHIYRLLASDYTRNGSIETLHKNIVYARTRPISDLGLRGHLSPPGKEDLQLIRHHLTQIKLAYSPVKKLEHLLSAAYCITNCLNSQCPEGRGSSSVQTDDFLPMLTYVIVDVGLVTAEIEADYMWGLLHSSQVSAEANYYLSTLSSAVLLLKIFKETHQTSASNGHQGRLPSISDMQGFLKVAFPDEFRDSIIWKTLPVRPNMTTKDVCAMIAHRFRITNPQDYGLFILVNGQEKFLAENTCPQNIKLENADAKQECIFAFKRTAANIAWPHQLQTC